MGNVMGTFFTFAYLKYSYDNFHLVIRHIHHVYVFHILDKIECENVKSIGLVGTALAFMRVK